MAHESHQFGVNYYNTIMIFLIHIKVMFEMVRNSDMMINIDDAYEIFTKMHDKPPLLMISEGPHYFKSDIYIPNKGFAIIRKDSGMIEYREPLNPIEVIFCDNIPVPEMITYYPRLYDGIVEYYSANKSEKLLARLYERAYFEKSDKSYDDLCSKLYSSRDDYKKIKERWGTIEQFLYSEIRKILDEEDIDYPPCVLNKWDDPFYRIKPFMVRNGYTDSATRRIWEKYKQ